MRPRVTFLDVLGLIGMVLLLAALMTHAIGCAWFQRGAAAVDGAAYERELDGCLVEARDAGRSLAVYERCAHEADIRHGVDAGKD